MKGGYTKKLYSEKIWQTLHLPGRQVEYLQDVMLITGLLMFRGMKGTSPLWDSSPKPKTSG